MCVGMCVYRAGCNDPPTGPCDHIWAGGRDHTWYYEGGGAGMYGRIVGQYGRRKTRARNEHSRARGIPRAIFKYSNNGKRFSP